MARKREHALEEFYLSQFVFQPSRHVTHDLVIGLAFLTAHVTGIGNNTNILRAAVLEQ